MKTLPTIKPILPVGRLQFPTDKGWIYELKYDGFRGVLYLEDSQARILTKNGKRHQAFSDLERRIARYFEGHEVILDGEVCALDANGYPIRRDIQGNKGSIVLIAFDIMWLDGHDLRGLPLKRRKEILRKLVKETMKDSVQFATYIEGSGVELFKHAYALGLEGIIAKRFKDLYTRSTQWLKIKNIHYIPPPSSKKRAKLTASNRS